MILYGQPKWTIGKNTCNTYEVFVERARLEDGTEVPSRPIIDYIEMDPELTDVFSSWFLETALQSAKDLTEKTNVHLTLSINVLPLYCNRRDYVERVQSALAKVDFPANKLQFEIEETQELSLAGIRNLNYLHNELGIGLWLGNFGVGHNNLNMLTRLDLDGIELHRYFTQESHDSEQAVRLLSAIAHFADSFNIKICAKGVETEEQMQHYEDFDFFKVQGSFIGLPMRFPELEEYIKNFAIFNDR